MIIYIAILLILKRVQSDVFQGWTFEDSLDACVRYGIDALEIRTGFHPWSGLELSDGEYERMYKEIRDRGLAVSDLGTSIRMTAAK